MPLKLDNLNNAFKRAQSLLRSIKVLGEDGRLFGSRVPVSKEHWILYDLDGVWRRFPYSEVNFENGGNTIFTVDPKFSTFKLNGRISPVRIYNPTDQNIDNSDIGIPFFQGIEGNLPQGNIKKYKRFPLLGYRQIGEYNPIQETSLFPLPGYLVPSLSRTIGTTNGMSNGWMFQFADKNGNINVLEILENLQEMPRYELLLYLKALRGFKGELNINLHDLRRQIASEIPVPTIKIDDRFNSYGLGRLSGNVRGGLTGLIETGFEQGANEQLDLDLLAKLYPAIFSKIEIGSLDSYRHPSAKVKVEPINNHVASSFYYPDGIKNLVKFDYTVAALPDVFKFYRNTSNIRNAHTYTFSNPSGVGSSRHFDTDTAYSIRTMNTDNKDAEYVIETLSDLGQTGPTGNSGMGVKYGDKINPDDFADNLYQNLLVSNRLPLYSIYDIAKDNNKSTVRFPSAETLQKIELFNRKLPKDLEDYFKSLQEALNKKFENKLCTEQEYLEEDAKICEMYKLARKTAPLSKEDQTIVNRHLHFLNSIPGGTLVKDALGTWMEYPINNIPGAANIERVYKNGGTL